jgi:hypothetical protein
MRFVLLLAGALLATSAPRVAWAQSPAPDSTSIAAADTLAAGEVPQRDVFDLLFKKDVETEIGATTRTGLSWALLPTISYNPVYGVALGVMATGAGQRGFSGARYSSLSISGNISTTGQIQAQVRGDVFSPTGDHLTRGDFRYLDTRHGDWDRFRGSG